MKSLLKYIALSIIAIQILPAQRIKDIAYVNGDNSTQVIGYAVVVGLGGTGDSHRTSFTIQSISSMLKDLGSPSHKIK